MLTSTIYLIIGIVLTVKWWKTEYKAQYEEAKASEDGVEKGTLCWLFIILLFFWPIKLFVDWIRKKDIKKILKNLVNSKILHIFALLKK